MQVRVGNKVLVAKALSMIGLDAEKTVRKAFRTSAKTITDKMSVPGKPVTYPIKWDSEKQRRYVMAMLREQNDLPYTRKGGYVASWKMSTIRGGYQVANKWNKAGFIAGDIHGKRQSRIVKGRWPVFRKVIDAALRLVPRQIVSDLKITFKRLGFRVRG